MLYMLRFMKKLTNEYLPVVFNVGDGCIYCEDVCEGPEEPG